MVTSSIAHWSAESRLQTLIGRQLHVLEQTTLVCLFVMMNFAIHPNELPKDARWVDFIPKLKCPQCVVYQASTLSQLERHVILHCKCRPPLLKNHFIRQLRIVSSQANEDVLYLVKLALEAKLLQWRKEGEFPEIPFLLKQKSSVSIKYGKSHSDLLDLWRLWHQEVDTMSLEYSPSDILNILNEAENVVWEHKCEVIPSVPVDDQLNGELMAEVNAKLAEMREKADSGDIDPNTIRRLEQESFLLS